MASGRPVLLIPYTESFPDVGERSIVAWDENCKTACRSPPVQSSVRTQIGNRAMRIYADLPSAPGQLAFTGLAI
jgi:hypothetical protein